MKVLIMGLGLHGGGLESARFLLKRGADLTVTDLRDEQTLAPSIEQLEQAAKELSPTTRPAPIRYVLGKHEIEDFKNADMVIKNPGVRPDSPFLQASRRIETDISLFLNEIHDDDELSPVRLTAVTGSKGKSSTASAIHWVLSHAGNYVRQPLTFFGIPIGRATAQVEGSGKSFLGGNITVSPLTFIDELKDGDDVVLELSSWQLGDLRGRTTADGTTAPGKALLKPKSAVLTPIMPDHLDRYNNMEDYVADKRVIYQGQDSTDFTIAQNDEWGKSFLTESKGTSLIYADAPLPEGVSGGWITDPAGPAFARLYGAAAKAAKITNGKLVALVPAQPLVPGRHQKQNLLAAGLALLGLGLPPEVICECLATFPGVEHRLELFHKAGSSGDGSGGSGNGNRGGISFYNDSAATIPEAAAAAVEALAPLAPLVLVTGGTDKNLDFTPLVNAAGQAKEIILLAGSGSDKLKSLFDDAGISYRGPFDNLEAAVRAALDAAAAAGTACSIALSPGCASFGMFLNEFDRGNKWKETVRRLL